MSSRRTIAFVAALLLVPGSFARAQIFKTQYGSNPLERVDGADYANGLFRIPPGPFIFRDAPYRQTVSPAYTSRYGVVPTPSGSYPTGRYWDPRRANPLQSGAGNVDPRTRITADAFYRTPILRNFYNIPHQQVFFGSPSAFPSLLAGAPRAPSSTGESATPSPAPSADPVPTSSTGSAPSGTYTPGLPSTGSPMAGLPGRDVAGYSQNWYYETPYGILGQSPQRPASMVPRILGAVVGAVLGGAAGGVMGAVLGGVGGLVVGGFFANQMAEAPYQGYLDNVNAGYYDPYGPWGRGGAPYAPGSTLTSLSNPYSTGNPYTGYQYNTDYYNMYYNRRDGNAGWLPGVAGAVLGAAMGSYSGIIGILVGGGVGYLAGSIAGKVLFPQNSYDSYGIGYVFPMQDPYNDLVSFRSELRPIAPLSGPEPSKATPRSQEDQGLVQARQDYMQKLDRLQKVLGNGSQQEKTSAQAEYETARKRYLGYQAPGVAGQ